MLYVRVYPDLDSVHVTQVYAGLFELAKQGRIELEFTAAIDERIRKSARNSVLCVQVSEPEHGHMRTVCFDMFDGCEISSVERLRLSDAYFKRSYDDEYVGGLDTDDRRKIIPYGLNFECRSRYERDILKRLFIYHRANRSGSEDPLALLKGLSGGVLRHLLLKADIDILGLKPLAIGDFEVQPNEPAEPKVLLQTRLWTPQECPRIAEDRLWEINAMRVNTVRSLRERFRGQFVGGLIPTALAREIHPDLCLPTENTKRRNFMDTVRKCLVCVTTTGLHDSIGFKLPEYLAASRCIVTEPPKHQLPVPLEEGTNYLPFRTADECVKACERLLSDPQFAYRMRCANYRYYADEVEPSALVQRCLTAAMAM
jgi:hypothetical protein